MNTVPITKVPAIADRLAACWFRPSDKETALEAIEVLNEYASLKRRADAVDGLVKALEKLIDFAEPILEKQGFGHMGKFHAARKTLANFHLAVNLAEPDTSLKADAERYRWLRANAQEIRDVIDRDYGFDADTPVLVMTVIGVFDDARRGVDDAIDAAIAAQVDKS